jgi:hypothetical protein
VLSTIRPEVLFLCSENSCRTQMAEAISGQHLKRDDPFMRERVSYLVTLCERDSERTLPNFSVRVPGAEMAD